MQEDGGAQFDTLSDKKKKLSMREVIDLWNDPKDPMIMTHVSSFIDIQKNYQIICSAYPHECTVDGVQKAQRFFQRVEKLKKRAALRADGRDVGSLDDDLDLVQ